MKALFPFRRATRPARSVAPASAAVLAAALGTALTTADTAAASDTPGSYTDHGFPSGAGALDDVTFRTTVTKDAGPGSRIFWSRQFDFTAGSSGYTGCSPTAPARNARSCSRSGTRTRRSPAPRAATASTSVARAWGRAVGCGPTGRRATPSVPGKLTRAYRPQTNGKVERFNRTLAEEWAYQRPYTSNDERTAALADFLHTYNHHRSHTALHGHPPITRVNNPAGQYT